MRPSADIAAIIARAAVAAASGLDEERASLYARVVLSRGEAALEALMLSGECEYQGDFARSFIAEGEARGKAESVLAVLEARGVPVSCEARGRIRWCRDLAELGSWLTRAVTATTVYEVLAPQGPG